MIAVLLLIFALIALAAAAFVVVPLMRSRAPVKADSNRLLYAAGGALAVVLIGLGVYGWLGQWQLALGSLTGPRRDDYPALIATLARQMPYRPNDVEGWTLLGRGYLSLNNPEQAQRAFQHAVQLAKARGGVPPDLLASYGQAIAEANGGVNKEAEAVFREALEENPGDLISRYYLGLGLASRGDKEGALQMWESLLADAPADVPWRGALVDQVAALKASAGGAAPNPMQMVQQLATRLESNPNDLDGWLRLIRAYSVLGDKDKAEAALTKAKTVFANRAAAQAQLAQSAKDNSL